MTTPYRLLQLALAVFGIIALLLYPLAVVWPSGWAWHAGAPHESQDFMMIVGLYATIGVLLLNAARKPEANLSFIWFVVWSSAVHAVIMAVQSFSGGHHGHIGHQAAQVRVAGPGRFADHLDSLDVLDDFAQYGLAFNPGELRAEAQVDTGAERDVARRITFGPKDIGIAELAGIAVGRTPGEQHACTLGDNGRIDLVVDTRCAVDALDRHLNRSCSSMAEPTSSGRRRSSSS
jgi:hypothetical protein